MTSRYLPAASSPPLSEKPRWHLARGGEPRGPLPASKLIALAGEDKLDPTDLVWRPGFLGWRKADEVPGLLIPPPLPQMAPGKGESDTGYAAPVAATGQPADLR